MKPAIKVANLGKEYFIGGKEKGNETFREMLAGSLAAPFLRLKNLKGHVTEEERFWALKDVSFDVKPGEVVGIIGRNGAGKSTLLKILSRITEPTTGEVSIRGRISSLLEVGTGFHPELTGRENIFLNGAILGMSRQEIRSKFDEIVTFSEVEKFLDTPVKRYSSGMYVRLAFAVAAHLDPEILIVDEVLAVGDAAFQAKCLGRIGRVAKEGRTVLFVSHNMGAIKSLCQRVIHLDGGRVLMDAEAGEVVTRYLNNHVIDNAVATAEEIEARLEGVIKKSDPYIRLRELAVMDKDHVPRASFSSDESVIVSFLIDCLQPINQLRIMLVITNEDGVPLLMSLPTDDSVVASKFHRMVPGSYRINAALSQDLLANQRYFLTVHLEVPKTEHLVLNNVMSFNVSFAGYNGTTYCGKEYFRPRLNWVISEVHRDQ